MGAMWLPTMAGIARMAPVRDAATPTNVGATWSVVGYTVPAGRALALDWAMLTVFGGTLPTVIELEVLIAGVGSPMWLFRETPPAVNQAVFLTNTVWLAETDILRFRIEGGGADTDMIWAFSGRIFDWVDVA